MRFDDTSHLPLAGKAVLIVGAGGIGAPLGIALARAGVRRFIVADDDRVERSNLHRQILFEESDVGTDKLDAYASALQRIDSSIELELVRSRVLPDIALDVIARADVVVDATDNFATRFLVADACKLQKKPVVHAAAVRWNATAMAASPVGAPCYRCLFEDVPLGDAPDCATAGVMGPVCGVAGALAADLTLRILRGSAMRESPFGFIITYDGKTDRLRRVTVKRRIDCTLCGRDPQIADLDEARYITPTCAAD